MKIVTASNGKKTVKMSKKEWQNIGKKAGWMANDPSDYSDADLNPIYTADEEENAIFGPDDPSGPDEARKEGYQKGLEKDSYSSDNPYRIDTKEGRIKYDQWMKGFEEAKKSKSLI